MILGLSTATYTLLHVLISLIGIGSGLVVLYGLLVAKPLNGITAIFLVSTVLTSASGFGFPFDHLLPSHIVGIISLVLLAFAIAGKYAFHLRGAWRWIYIVSGMMALYLNVFVLIIQLFEKVPALKALAPKQNEPPFAVSQLTVLALFIVFTILAIRKFRVGPAQAA